MDNRRRPLEDYYNAARREEGISEREIRSIVEGGGRGREAFPTRARRRIAGWLGVGLTLAVVALVLTRSDAPEAVASRAPIGVRDAAPAAPPVPPAAAWKGAPAAKPSTASVPATPIEHIDQRHTDIRENQTMIMYPRMKSLLLGVAIAGTAAASTHAQQSTAPSDSFPLLKELEREIAPMIVDYWEVKLNGYRSTIDGFLPQPDLAELNRVRVQWGISLAREGGDEGSGDGTMRSSIHLDTAAGKSEVRISVMGKKSPDEAEEYMEEHPDAAMEFLGAHQRVHDIAERNRAQFDMLRDRVMDDAAGFLGMIRDRVMKFASDHRSELERSKDGQSLLDAMNRADKSLSQISGAKSREVLSSVYGMILEPLVMLYDGGGVKGFFEQAGPMASVMPGWALEDRSALRSCAPNPASTSATVTYQLAEPSGKTFLKLFNAQGEEVGSYELGERPAGRGSVVIDVASLAPGTYLYRLTTSTSKGEQVFSKTMQVLR